MHEACYLNIQWGDCNLPLSNTLNQTEGRTRRRSRLVSPRLLQINSNEKIVGVLVLPSVLISYCFQNVK